MTRREKIDALEWYCDHCGDTCDECKLKNMYDEETDEFIDNYSCAFDEMDDKMLEKIYDWYKEPDTDMVNHPSHYTQGGIECIDALKAATVSKTGIEAVCTANAIKYLWRYEEKNGVEDVKKARWYIDRLIEELENG